MSLGKEREHGACVARAARNVICRVVGVNNRKPAVVLVGEVGYLMLKVTKRILAQYVFRQRDKVGMLTFGMYLGGFRHMAMVW